MFKFKNKKKKPKKYWIRHFFKELKRVKWPIGSYLAKNYFKVLIFILVATIVFFIILTIATVLWNKTGVGL
ncbi:preprotein translocase subunit SecE [Mesomycoplasma hyorhinis]|uniref:preprotein translocase subunit SecE n=1 Tax=Mesomycoplasma hyorhinis TaxID=2100 RepID=UPI001C04AB46|nr:preprotein translocase subunit SecE [Mesomycoplasma hyorhinis]